MTEAHVSIVCLLDEQERVRRTAEVLDLFKRRLATHELTDGFEVEFPADTAASVLDFILFERECCPFFDFALQFEADQGPMRLRIGGPPGAKEMIEELLAQTNS